MTKLWLHPLTGKHPRSQQSKLARDLLRFACATQGIAISNSNLALSGLEIIKLFKTHKGQTLSIAHCPGMLAVALGPGKLGVDCESKGRDRNWHDISQQFFTSNEASNISLALDIKAAFLRHWVIKEAYVKATGGSIFGDLNKLQLNNDNEAWIESNLSNWRGWRLELAETPIAVCTQDPEPLETNLVHKLSARQSLCVTETLPSSTATTIRILNA